MNKDIACNIGGIDCHILFVNQEHLAQRVQKAAIVVIDCGVLDAMYAQECGRLPDEDSGPHSNSEDNRQYHTHAKSKLLKKLCGTVPCVVVPSGEQGKGKACYNLLLETLFAHTLVRKDEMLVIGGGAVCDMASYVASSYMRGIGLTLVPSTLLAMADASIGGKTAINFANYKNMVGAFYPAQNILVVPELLSTLTSCLIRDGLAEIIKAGMLQDEEILRIIETHGAALWKGKVLDNLDIWRTLVQLAIQVKVSVVEEDFKERGVRAFLNLGHTFAHAHEACARRQGESVSHGEAVGLGIRAALTLGLALEGAQGTNREYAERIFAILDTCEYAVSYAGYNAEELVQAMVMDKKRATEGVRFIVQRNICDTHMLTIADTQITNTLQALGAE